MNPFGIFLIIYVTLSIFKKKVEDRIISLVSMTIFVENFVYYGYFMRVGGVMIRYHEFLISILFMIMIFFLISKKIDRKVGKAGILLLSAIILSNIFLIINPLNYPVISYGQSWYDYFYKGYLSIPFYSLQTTLMSLRLFIFIIISTSLISLKNMDLLKKISDNFLKYGVFIIFYGFLEFFAKNIFRSDILYTINTYMLGVEGNPYIVRGGLVAIRGLMIEPAHFAESLFYYSVILILSNKSYVYKIRLTIAIAFLQFFSGSFTGAGLSIVAILLVLLLEKRKKHYIVLLSFVFIILIFTTHNQLILNYYDRLLSSLQLLTISNHNIHSQSLSSEAIRIISVKETFNLFKKRPVLGLGIGVTWGHGFLASMLVSIGLLGSYLWFKFFSNLGRLKISFSNYVVVTVLGLSWLVVGDMGTMYSMTTLMIALQFRIKNFYTISEEMK